MDSSNYNPCPVFAIGAHMVALNYQARMFPSYHPMLCTCTWSRSTTRHACTYPAHAVHMHMHYIVRAVHRASHRASQVHHLTPHATAHQVNDLGLQLTSMLPRYHPTR